MTDTSGRRPDLLESLLGMCEPGMNEAEEVKRDSVEPARDVATIVAGLQDPDVTRRRDALNALARQGPDLRALARISLSDTDDLVRAEATAVVATLGTGAVGDLASQAATPGYPRAQQVALAGLDALIARDSSNEEMFLLLAGLESMAVDPDPGRAVLLQSIGATLGLDRLGPWRPRFPRATSLLLDGPALDASSIPTALLPSMPASSPAPSMALPADIPTPPVQSPPAYVPPPAEPAPVAYVPTQAEPAAPPIPEAAPAAVVPPPIPEAAPAAVVPPPIPEAAPVAVIPPPIPQPQHSDSDAAAAAAVTPPPIPGPAAQTRRTAPDDRSTLLLTSLAVALGDESDAVRERATKALLALDRETVQTWVSHLLVRGSDRDARLAVGVARIVGMSDLGAEVLRRAAEAPAGDDVIFLDALRAWSEAPATTVANVQGVVASRRHDALRAAWRLHGEAILPYVEALLGDSAGPVRTAALEILGLGDEGVAAEAAMRTLTTDSSPSVRTTAVKILGRTNGPARAHALHRALADPDPDVRAAGVKALLTPTSPNGGGLDDAEAAGLLLQALSDPEEWVWRSAVEQLATLADAVPSVVWTALRQGPDHQQEQLLVLLEVRRPEQLGTIAVGKLSSRDEEDRVLAVRIIGLVGSAEGVQRVIQSLYDPSAAVRRAAAEELSGLQSPEAVPSLTHALLDPDHGVRLAAVAALGVIDDDSVIPALVAALTDPNDEVRQHAASVISRWSSPSVARALVDFLTRAQLDSSAVELLVGMGPSAIEPLMDALASADEETRPVLGQLLERVIGLDALLDQARSLDPEVRLRAVEGVAAIGGERAIGLLTQALSDPHVPVRISALRALGHSDDPRALNAIRACRTMDPVAEVVSAADEALREAHTVAQAIYLDDPVLAEPPGPAAQETQY